MDANALLAIYTKVQQIYNTGDSKFLSFPLDFQFIFSPESLRLLFEKDAATAVSFLNQRADFSRIMNRPVKSLFPAADTGDLLWDVYQGILTSAEIAENAMSASEKEAYRKAEEFLFVQDENGLTVPSEKNRQYSAFRDRDFTLKEEIQNLNASETLSPEEREIEMAKLKAALAENEALWTAGGLRQEVEKHLKFREKVMASSPLTAWAKLKDKCQADLSVQTDLTGDSFATTFLFPGDVLNQPWCSINVGKEEVDDLLAQASSDIKKRLNSQYTDPIESFSFEYRSVGVQRPWFDSDLFKSRLWRLPDSSIQKISYGKDSMLGRFPAYISALLLLRNFRITYASGKTVTSFGSLSANQAGSDQEVSVLAYICKKLPTSPDPDEGVQWPTIHRTAPLRLEQQAGGKIHAYIRGEEVDSGTFAVGEKILVKAVADANCILSYWKVNDKVVENLNYACECVLEENGLTITPFWEFGETLDPAHVKVRDHTLLALDKGPVSLDMNRFSDLCQVKAVGEKAFENYASLCNLIFGKTVEIIGEQVAPNCTNLEKVFIPARTRSVHKRAFVRNGFLEEPFIRVSPSNETYTSLDGTLLDKKRTMTVQVKSCSCGAKYIYSDQAPAVCPKCGAALEAFPAKETTIRRPDARIPFRVSEQEARELVREFFGQEHFVEKAFKEQVAQEEIPLKPVYVPMWEWRIQEERTQKDATFANEAPVRNSMVAMPSSQLVGDNIVDTNDLYAERFAFGQAPAGTAFELYAQNIRDCQKAKRQAILDALREKDGPASDGAPQEQVNYVSEGSRLVYNPFWLGSLTYQGESYPVYVDGYSRKVYAGKSVPKESKKPWMLIGGILAGLALVALVLFLILGRGSKRADTKAPAVSDRSISVTEPASDGFTLQWMAAKDKVTPADSIRYQVFLQSPGETSWQIAHEGLGISSYRFSNLKLGNRYRFYVTAGDLAGNSVRYLDGETTVEDCDPPTVVDKGFKVLPFEKSVIVCWGKARDNGTPEDQVSYQVLLKGPGESDWRTVKEADGIFSFQFTDLKPDTEYSCTVKATDQKGNAVQYDVQPLRTLALPEMPESTAYEVVLVDAGPSIQKVVLTASKNTGRGRLATQNLVEKAPVTLKSYSSKDKAKADALKEALAEAGATVEIVER